MIRGAWQATTITDADGTHPWFEDPEEHFFNTLYTNFAEPPP
ncbi:hypothetical protein [Spirillospora sp. NPDC029432]